MRLRLIIRIAIIVTVLLLCTGFGVYSFLRLNAVEEKKEFNLFTLVPPNAIAVLETDRMAEFVSEINELSCSKDNHFLSVSNLFVYLKNYLHTLVDDTPHGLSKEMNKMLISFHEPDNQMNQVLYCSLGEDDNALVETFIKKYCSTSYPSKYFDYKGEEICIYPMENGSFLAVYITSDYLVVSFQKRLIEQVIDAEKTNCSLMDIAPFSKMQKKDKSNTPTTVYVRAQSLDMGKKTDGIRSQTSFGGWVEFSLKLNENAIYCSGISHDTDTLHTFVNAMRMQQPVEGFPGERLPLSTFFYDCRSVSDMDAMYCFTENHKYAKATYSDCIKERDEEWFDYLKTHIDSQVTSCLFQSDDTLNRYPCAVMVMPLKDEPQAERSLRLLLHVTPKEVDAPLVQQSPEFHVCPNLKQYRLYTLPRNTLLAQFTGITESTLNTHVCFYKGNLLMSPDVASLTNYIDALENGEVLNDTEMYEESISSLSSSYNSLLMVDMEEMIAQPETYVRLLPSFFFKQADFFKNFIFAIQFTCGEKKEVYPNIVFLYKGSKI